MGDRYYLIKEMEELKLFLILPSERDEPKYVMGDKSLTKITEFKEGNLVRKSNASDKYKVLEVGPFQFEVSVEQYKHSLEVTNN